MRLQHAKIRTLGLFVLGIFMDRLFNDGLFDVILNFKVQSSIQLS
jgi:hypothetical protein